MERHLEELQYELLKVTKLIRHCVDAGSPNLDHYIGKRDGLATAYEVLTGIPRATMVAILTNLDDDFLKAWSTGERDFSEVMNAGTW